MVLCRRTLTRLKGRDSSLLNRPSHGTNTSFARFWTHRLSVSATATGSSTGPVNNRTFPAFSNKPTRWVWAGEYSAFQFSSSNPNVIDSGRFSSSTRRVCSRVFSIQRALVHRMAGISDRLNLTGTTTSSPIDEEILMITCRARLLSLTLYSGMVQAWVIRRYLTQ